MGITDLWDQLVNCICRPPRDTEYTVDDLVGGRDGGFALPGHRGYSAQREDMVLTNKRGLKLQCSHYVPQNVIGRDNRLPCVIYCHCNSGSRRDCEEALYQLLPLGISVFACDFAGSGLSEGGWVTLGAHEVDDVETVVAHLRSTGRVSTLGLWGRSMGAVTALLYAQRDPSIAGIVLDSPFSSLTELMLEIVEEQQLPIPKALMKVALAAMRRSVRKRAEFDINDVSPLSVVPQSFIPALFGHATSDTFIKIHHTEKLYEAYAGDKNFIKVEGDHNSPRPVFFKHSVAIFFTITLQLEEMLLGGNSVVLEQQQNVEAAASAARRMAASAATDVTPPSGPAAAATSPASVASAIPPSPEPAVPPAGLRGASSAERPGPGGIPWQLESIRLTTTPSGRPIPDAHTAGGGGSEAGGVHSGLLARPGVGGAAEGGGEGEEDEQDEADLMRAIELSLLEHEARQRQAGEAPGPPAASQQPAAPQGPERSPSTGGEGARGLVLPPGGKASNYTPQREQQQQQQQRQAPPPGSTARRQLTLEEEEEAMLARAIALSLQEAARQGGGADAPPAAAPAAAAPPPDYVDLLVRELSGGLPQPRASQSSQGASQHRP